MGQGTVTGPADMGDPHPEQNLAPDGLAAPHLGQTDALGAGGIMEAPQLPQNLDAAELATPQLGQRTVAPVTPPMAPVVIPCMAPPMPSPTPSPMPAPMRPPRLPSFADAVFMASRLLSCLCRSQLTWENWLRPATSPRACIAFFLSGVSRISMGLTLNLTRRIP